MKIKLLTNGDMPGSTLYMDEKMITNCSSFKYETRNDDATLCVKLTLEDCDVEVIHAKY